MEQTKLLTYAVVGLLVLNLLTVGFLVLKPGQVSQSDQRPGPPSGGEPAKVIIERLHFDAQQQQQYRKFVAEHQQQTRMLNEESVKLFRDYYGLLESDRTDSMQANVLSQQIADNQQALAQLNFAHFQQIKALCHPDQRADFARLVEDLSRLFGRQQRPRRPGGDGPPDGRPEGPPEHFPPRP